MFGREVRIERKSRKETNRQFQRWPPSANRDAYHSPRYNRFHGQREGEDHGYGMASPETPGRPNFQLNNQSAAGTPGPMNPYGPPFDGRDWGSPLPSYTTSPYANPQGSAGYNAATPQMPAPYGGQMTPYGYYPATNYSWMSPYMFNPVAVTHAAYNSQLPPGNAQPAAVATGHAEDDEVPETPTRKVNRNDEA